MLHTATIARRCIFLFAVLAAFVVGRVLAQTGPASQAAAAVRAPIALLCEGMQQPLGIDVTQPRLTWRLSDVRRGARQTAYEIQVASSAENLEREKTDVWDSGKVESGDSVNVSYQGPAPASAKRYYWRVRVWDQSGKPSAYSKPSWWEMGLLSASDWHAKWITPDKPVERADYASNAKWIWSAGEDALSKAAPGTHEFRFDFSLAAAPKTAELFITGKDNIAVWLDGKQLVEASPMTGFGRPRDPWGSFRRLSIDSLVAGKHSIAAQVTVYKPRWPGRITGGFIAMLRVQMPDGTFHRFVTGSDWRATSEVKDDSWTSTSFDDSSWPQAEVAAEIGQDPLGTPWPAEAVSLLRKQFGVSKSVRSARVYSTALGSYQLYLNGKQVGDDILAPGWTDYRKRVPYQVYDVTARLHTGENAIGAILGGGWYADGLGWLQNRYNFGPPPTRILVQLQIEYSDGSRDSVVSDESWNSSSSPILSSEIYDGETYDARLEDPSWSQPVSAPNKKNSWHAVAIAPTPEIALVAQDFQPIRIHEILKPKSVTNPVAGVYIFDLGQNMVGWARLHVSGKIGTKVRLRFGEVLQPNGQLYTANLRTAEATDTYTLRGEGNETFHPHFTFHGFRYVELTGFPGTPTRDSVEGVAFYTAAPFTMKFHSGSAMVNQLWSNILWGQRGNFLSVPTDCPQRDERLGWMGDAEVFWRTASFDANLEAFSRKFTTDIRDAQSPAGAYSDVSPRVGDTGESVAGWADGGVIIPYSAYLQYRDKRILEENWPAMEKWLDHIHGANPDYLWLKSRGSDYGDWLAIGSQTPKDLIATAFWAYDATLMKQMAQALGRDSAAQKYGELFDNIKAAFNKAFVKDDGTVGSGSQTCYVLALHMNLLEPEKRVIAVKNLVADIGAHDSHLTTGFLGTPYLLLELSNSGHSDVAYRLLLQKTFPSWGYMIDHGATTMWERWNGNQKLDDPSMNSFNHYAYGSVAEWLYRYVAGIDESVDDPGFHRILLHPQFSPELGEASATYESAYGAITSSWKITSGSVHWTAVIPANTSALLYFPEAVEGKIAEGGASIGKSASIKFVRKEGGSAIYEAGAGSYSFDFRQ